ncbi:MAG: hypothetical protein H6818_22185 [Phycisphaerales bacterium]|nr:hypothetical protein [Phycisphaerales bacterium]MCB9862502.1 hypothetical protein [Phycisphaerales bacterium]
MSIHARHDSAILPPSLTDSGEHTTLTCPVCSYDLRGLDHNRCPECGGIFTPESILQSNVKRRSAPLSPAAIVGELLTLSVIFNTLLICMLMGQFPFGVLAEYPIDLIVCISLSRRWSRGYTAFKMTGTGRTHASRDDLRRQNRLRVGLLALSLSATTLVIPLAFYVIVHYYVR